MCACVYAQVRVCANLIISCATSMLDLRVHILANTPVIPGTGWYISFLRHKQNNVENIDDSFDEEDDNKGSDRNSQREQRG